MWSTRLNFFSRNSHVKTHLRNLFTVSLSYCVPINEVEKYLDSHRTFLEKYYEKGVFIASGAKIPRTGGIIIASSSNKDHLNDILKEDPFYRHQIAKYEITEFMPTMYNDDFKSIAIKDNNDSSQDSTLKLRDGSKTA